MYHKPPDSEAVEWHEAIELQGKMWRAGSRPARSRAAPADDAGLQELNAMMDIATTRLMATQVHPAPIFYVMLSVVAFLAALLAGYGMASSRGRSWIHVIAFAAVFAVTVYAILRPGVSAPRDHPGRFRGSGAAGAPAEMD